MTIPFWDAFEEGYESSEITNPWDIVVLNGFRAPGVAEVKCTPQLKIDLPKKASHDGGPAIERGHLPAKVDISMTVWTPAQWIALQELLFAIWRKPGEKFRLENDGGVPSSSSTKGKDKKGNTILVPKPAITIAHPACALWGVTSILIEQTDSPVPGQQTGSKVVRLRGYQYIAPSKKTATKPTAGARAPIAKEFKQAHNATPAKPSTTDAVPKPGPPPHMGGA